MENKIDFVTENDRRMIAFQRLLNIMDDLREKCPWDMKQTFETLRHLTIEETYELGDAIVNNDMESIKGEIGDLFLHMVFYCKLGSEAGAFDVTSVLNAICDKLVFRHPHIYSDTTAETEEEVKANWEKLKLKEGKKSVLEGVPNGLASLVKSMRIQEKVRGIGFDWDNVEQVKEKVNEELKELDEAIESNDASHIEEEFGDVLFALVNYSRFIDVNPDTALTKANQKFITRFKLMEELVQKEGKALSDMNLAEMDTYWDKAKLQLKK